MESATTTMTHIPLHLISTSSFNPRRYFDEAEMAELTASVKVMGIIQPINVRPLSSGRYEIVAGERRYRAAVAAELAEIPAMVNVLSDEDAEQVALVENVQRADMSVGEEAVAAGRILDKAKGDRDEAATVLGWPMSKLNRRIALLNLAPEVMDALAERKILVSHAELICTVPKDKQIRVLSNVLDKNLSVQDVKKFLAGASTGFKAAIFDTALCIQCKYNSSIQSSLFKESIGENDRCTNSECFKAKTDTKIAEIQFNLSEEVQTVKIIDVGDSGFVKLSVDGSNGVGVEQYEACRACVSLGATVSRVAGEVGATEREICFNPDCNMKKVAERIKAGNALEAITKKEGKTAAAGKTVKGSSGSSETKKVADLSQKIKDYRRKEVWEKAAKKELAQNIPKAKSFALDLLLTGDGRLMDKTKLVGYFGKIAGVEYPVAAGSYNIRGCPESTHVLDSSQQDKLFAAAAVSAISSSEFKDERLIKLLGFLETDLSAHFTLTEAFLTLLTKNEIEAVCVSVGLDKAVTGFKKLIGGKRDEAIKGILAAEFKFEGAIPPILNYI